MVKRCWFFHMFQCSKVCVPSFWGVFGVLLGALYPNLWLLNDVTRPPKKDKVRKIPAKPWNMDFPRLAFCICFGITMISPIWTHSWYSYYIIISPWYIILSDSNSNWYPCSQLPWFSFQSNHYSLLWYPNGIYIYIHILSIFHMFHV